MTDDEGARRPGFEVTRRGYRTSQVDAWVDRTAERLEALERDLDDARQLARSLQVSLDEARTRSGSETFGARAEKVLRLAEHDARLRRERAEREAEEIRELAHFEAERTVAEARAEVAAARRDADLCANSAVSMHDHVRSVRTAVRDEVARLHATLGAELRALDAPPPQAPATAASEPGAPTPQAPTPVAPAAVRVASLRIDSPTDPGAPAVVPTGNPPDSGNGTDTGAVARVVALPEQRDRPPREQVAPSSGAPAVAAGE